MVCLPVLSAKSNGPFECGTPCTLYRAGPAPSSHSYRIAVQVSMSAIFVLLCIIGLPLLLTQSIGSLPFGADVEIVDAAAAR